MEEVTEVLVEGGSGSSAGEGDGSVQDAPAENIQGGDTGESDLPPELQALVDAKVKSFQADYTKKRKEESELLTKAQEKAAAFERLISDPNYRQQFIAALGVQPAQQSAQREAWMDLDPASVFDEKTHDGIRAAQYRMFQQQMAPIVQELEKYKALINDTILPAVKTYQSSSVQSEWKGLEAKYQGVAQHKEAVEALRKQAPNLTIEQALYAVAGPTLRALGPGTKAPENKQQGVLFNGTTAAANGRPSAAKVDLTSLVDQALRRSGR